MAVKGAKGGWGGSVHKSCGGGLRTSTAADAGDVCSGGVKGRKGLQHLKGREVGCEGVCVRNRSKDGMRCRIECAVDVRRDGGEMGKGGWGGGLSRRLLVVGRYGARQRFKGRRQSCIEGVGSVV